MIFFLPLMTETARTSPNDRRIIRKCHGERLQRGCRAITELARYPPKGP